MEKELEFKAINDGLGFHPFSEGLPYSPPTKKNVSYSTGAGAVSAGTPIFVYPSQPSPPAPVIAPKIENKTPIENLPRWDLKREDLSYSFKRAIAFLIDCFFSTALCLSAFTIAIWKQNLRWELLKSFDSLLLVGVFVVFFNGALIMAQEIGLKTTLGKRLVGLKIEGPSTLILLRSVLFFVSSITLGAGLLWALFDKEKRCWHDVATGIRPTRRSVS